ncbi:hypothetical protein [Microbacterium capsulatum]|uniref:O-antigen ligase domain-containing protein n=1 Tax=Microbacterium capsulatum TaxID=3041921 RepID=A0ABU0XGJ4_9MICO|nr:hypothetical protein [Microbacterium sp. ASV81]MDQ4214246.1 hypothetical protein [Microbacterium sp. ASV81]
MSNRAKFAIVFVVVNMHMLRNVSFSGYITVYALIAFFLLAELIVRPRPKRRRPSWGPIVLWIWISALGFVVSLATISVAGAATGLSRFLFAVPIIFALYLFTETFEDLTAHVKTFVVFFALASMTLPLQLVTGPIGWFATATDRGGMDRYSSLVGSLTSIGVVVGCYLLLTQGFPGRSRAFWMLLIAGSAAISLSKAAIANVAIAFAIILLINRKSFSRLVLGLGAVAVIGLCLYSYVPIVQERVDVVLVSFGIQNSSVVNYDVTAEQSLIDRLVELPRANVAVLDTFHSPLVYLFGAGFGMGNTALVPEPDVLAPMAHNQYVELYSVFGWAGAVGLVLVLLVVLIRIARIHHRVRMDVTRAILWAYVILLVNAVTANGAFYQPAGASVLYLAFFLAVAPPYPQGRDGSSAIFETGPEQAMQPPPHERYRRVG